MTTKKRKTVKKSKKKGTTVTKRRSTTKKVAPNVSGTVTTVPANDEPEFPTDDYTDAHS